MVVSIHAPLRGATFPLVAVSSTVDGFNPRTPAGCDDREGAKSRSPRPVSIHAPLRGATTTRWTSAPNTTCFNPRTPAGCDVGCLLNSPRSFLFQSTHPCGVRLLQNQADDCEPQLVSIHAPLRGATFPLVAVSSTVDGFNPRTPAGCDTKWAGIVNAILGFNPRTPAGCDRIAPCTSYQETEVSIHAPLRGATPNGPGSSTRSWVSIHAPLRGATRLRP